MKIRFSIVLFLSATFLSVFANKDAVSKLNKVVCKVVPELNVADHDIKTILYTINKRAKSVKEGESIYEKILTGLITEVSGYQQSPLKKELVLFEELSKRTKRNIARYWARQEEFPEESIESLEDKVRIIRLKKKMLLAKKKGPKQARSLVKLLYQYVDQKDRSVLLIDWDNYFSKSPELWL